MGNDRCLFRTHGSTVQRTEFGYEAVGSGSIWAKAVLSSSRQCLSDEHAAMLAACYAVFSAKERDGYCGKDTHIVSLRRDTRMLLPDQAAIRAVEDVFRRHDKLQAAMFDAVLPSSEGRPISADKEIASIRAELNAIDLFPKLREADPQ
jgi:hypothetical protein